ncbi:uncharacterized protein ARMOST_18957 [Armillaria ostoyae]|uniref:Uncharacterized protein n=1 Tax=Armillaria ostoyae TaxID=47428 RepID=A0A284S3A0_ARMOS|nr:uncharacterized protein ARMOST_18957 [Armillaria ostoyae]
MAQPADTPSHAGSWVYASPYRIVSISPSHTAPGPSPALSTSPEARTSSSPPTAHRAAALSHHVPAHMPSTLQAAPSLLEGVVPSSPPPLASPLHVKPTLLDHEEVVSLS